MLAARGYRTKKELKNSIGETFHYKETSIFGAEFKSNGDNTVVGPDEYHRKWFATVTCKNGKIERVK